MKDKYPKVNRVEVIDNSGRAFVGYYETEGVDVQIQDEGRTMKVFIEGVSHD